MKVSVNDNELFTLTDLQKQVLLDALHCETDEALVADLSRRLHWVLMPEKHDKCLARLIDKWKPILNKRGIALPINAEDAVKLIFSQPDYKNRAQREADDEAVRQQLADEAKAQRAEEAAVQQKAFDDTVKAAVAQALAQQSAP